MPPRKRARPSEPAQSSTPRYELRYRPPIVHTSGWHTIMPELLLHIAAHLACWQCTCSGAWSRLQLNGQLASVCVAWRSVVYREGDSRGSHVDFWSFCSGVRVMREERDKHHFSVQGRRCPARLVPGAVACLRSVHALELDFSQYSPRCDVVAAVTNIQRFAHLTYLDLDLTYLSAELLSHGLVVGLQAALQAAMTAIAGRTQALKTLLLLCPPHIRVSVDVLRRLCSSVHELGLSLVDMERTALGDAALPGARVWQAHTVQSFSISHLATYNFSDKLIPTLVASLPACTHLNVDHVIQRYGFGDASFGNMTRVLGPQLRMLSFSSPERLDALISSVVHCTALVSLSIYHGGQDGLTAAQTHAFFDVLAQCASLVELTMIAVQVGLYRYGQCLKLSRLRYLQIHSFTLLEGEEEWVWRPYSLHIPNSVTHLALSLIDYQPVPLLQTLTRLPHLTHCFVFFPWPETADGIDDEQEARENLKERLGAAWCEREDDVTRWRSDRVWRRSLGLCEPDQESQCQKAFSFLLQRN